MNNKIKTYNRDKRIPLDKIYSLYKKLDKTLWTKEILYTQKDNNYSLPIFAYKTKRKGPALVIISGVHGEEPAGVGAIAENINFLNNLSKKIPIILIPLANPLGYRKNWRYPNMRRYPGDESFKSVGDSEPYLPNLKSPNKPRKKIILPEAKSIVEYIIATSKTHMPILSLDFHEDESKSGTYIYSQGKLGAKDPVAKQIADLLRQMGFRFYKRTKTTFNQPILDGIVSDPHDNTIDELLGSEHVFLSGKKIKGPGAKSVIVIETNTIGVPIKKRIAAHSRILKMSMKFYEEVKKI